METNKDKQEYDKTIYVTKEQIEKGITLVPKSYTQKLWMS